jgi:plasmid segregation protein ParM
MNILGIDAGNSKCKVMGEFGTESFVSSICKARERNLEQKFGEDDMIVEYEGNQYFAGSLATHESRFGSAMMGDTKAHEHAKLRTLIAIHRYYERLNTSMSIVVGQPITKHNQKEKDRIKQMLMGWHTLTVNGVEKRFFISRVEVAAEGGASFWSNPQMGLIRILDVGSGTVNAATLKDKRYIDKDSFTLSYGMETQDDTDIEDMSNGIAGECLKRWKRNDLLWLIGGAAETIQPYIKNHFPNSQVLRPNIKVGGGIKSVSPIYANAIGFYQIARGVFSG